jgi:diguanylate cyclase (GGDEF)-like protein/PAS domain S-box-containing protein
MSRSLEQPEPAVEAPLDGAEQALAFLHRAVLALGAVPSSGDGLFERIGLLLREPLPQALAVVCSFDARVTLFHPEAIGGPPEAVSAIEQLLTGGGYGYDIACLDDRWKRLLEPRLYRVRGGVADLSCGQVPVEPSQAFAERFGIRSCLAMGLTHERQLLGAVALLLERPLSELERETLEALIQHAAVALHRKRVEDELRSVAGRLQQSVGKRTQELSDRVTRLGHAQSRLRSLVDALDVTALLVSADGRLLACNQLVADRLGRGVQDVVGVHSSEFFPPERAQLHQEMSREAATSGRSVHYTERIDGRVRACSLHPVYGDDGQIQSFASFARDITQQHQREQRLRRAGAFQTALLQSVSEGILVLDDQGVVSECNRAVLASFGMEREELLGRPGVSLCAELAGWESWERDHLPKLAPGGEPAQIELRMRRMDGSTFTAKVGASRLQAEQGESGVVWVVRDVTDELLRVEQLEYLATHDDLTGLPNRLLFQDRLDRARQAGRRYGTGFALLLLDLDGFKEVNDTHGHELGDRLLAALGTRLRGTLRAADTFSRLGGDEFAVLLPNPMPPSQVVEVAEKLLVALERPFSVGGQELSVSASIGVAVFPQHEGERFDLLARADRAMYAAKRRGGQRVVMYSDDLEERS